MEVAPADTDLGGLRTAFRMRDTGTFPAVPQGVTPTVTYYAGHPSGQNITALRLDNNFAASVSAEFHPHITIPVFIHGLQGPTMNSGLNAAAVVAMINDVNTIWSQAGRSFDIIGQSGWGAAGASETLTSDDLLDVRDNGQGPIGELEEVTDINEQSNAIDIYFVSKIYSLSLEIAGTRSEINGSTIRPTGNPFGQDPGIIIAGKSPKYNANPTIKSRQIVRTISHELGHYLMKLDASAHNPEVVERLMSSGASDEKRDLSATEANTVRTAGVAPNATD